MPDALGRQFGSSDCAICGTTFEQATHSQIRCASCKTKRRIHCAWCGLEAIVNRLSAPVRRSSGYQYPRTCSQGCAGRLKVAENNPSSPWPRPTPPPNDCLWCGRPNPTPRMSFCSRACNEIASDPRRSRVTPIEYRDCRECGALFACKAIRPRSYCSDRCAARTTKRDRRHRERAAGMRNSDSITLREVAERDAWRCHLCGKHVPDRPSRSRPNDPTIDHLIPLSDEGQHTWDNVALAHFQCNWRRGADGPAQLRLAG